MNDLTAKIYNELTKICVCDEFAGILNYCDFITCDLDDFKDMTKIVLNTACKACEYDFTIKKRKFPDRQTLEIISGLWVIEIEYLLPIR